MPRPAGIIASGRAGTAPGGTAIARYSALDLALADAATVTTWPDSVGSADLTATGAPSFNAAGDYVVYNGTSDFHAGALAVSNPSTTIALFRFTGSFNNKPVIGSSPIFSMATDSSSMFIANAGAALTSSSTPTINTWHCIAFVATGGSDAKLYRNGTLIATGSAGSNSRSSVRIATNTAGSAFTALNVKDVLVYNTALNGSAIATLATDLATEHGVTLG